MPDTRSEFFHVFVQNPTKRTHHSARQARAGTPQTRHPTFWADNLHCNSNVRAPFIFIRRISLTIWPRSLKAHCLKNSARNPSNSSLAGSEFISQKSKGNPTNSIIEVSWLTCSKTYCNFTMRFSLESNRNPLEKSIGALSPTLFRNCKESFKSRLRVSQDTSSGFIQKPFKI